MVYLFSLFGAVGRDELACGTGLRYKLAPPPPKKKIGGLSRFVAVDQSVDDLLFEFFAKAC